MGCFLLRVVRDRNAPHAVSRVLDCTPLWRFFLSTLCLIPTLPTLGLGLWHAMQVLRRLGESGRLWERSWGKRPAPQPHQRDLWEAGSKQFPAASQVGLGWEVGANEVLWLKGGAPDNWSFLAILVI